MADRNGRGPRTVVIGAPRDVPGRIVITDEAMRRRISPPPSEETMRRIEALERSSAAAAHRLSRILMD